MGLTCENNSQNFALRHEGFDDTAEPKSATAFNVNLTDCTSIVPRKKNASTLDRRHINIQGYDGVAVNGFTMIGTNVLTPPSDPSNTSDASSSVSVAAFGNATNITFRDVRVQGVIEATTLFQVNSTSLGNVKFDNTRIYECLGQPFNIASGVTGVCIDRVRADTTQTPTPNEVIRFTNSPSGLQYQITDVEFTGYTNAYNLNATDYADPINILNLYKGKILISGLPTSDPGLNNQLWESAGDLRIS
jgi:hypothetical protein